MNNFFNQFVLSLEYKQLDSISLLNQCFKENSKSTLRKLYKEKTLFKKEFLELDFAGLAIPECYKILFAIILVQIRAQEAASLFIRIFSKEQLLQGVANYLEKNNSELKYNATWSEKYAMGNAEYLETERQATYFSEAGIQFQEILMQFYANASITATTEVTWDTATAEKFTELFRVTGLLCELKDIIERHLFFDWSLEVVEQKAIITLPPTGQKEGNITTDLINSMKSKIALEGIDVLARQQLAKKHIEKISNPHSHPKEFWKYVPDENNPEEMKLYGEAFMLDIAADSTVEMELALCTERYFPGIEDLENFELIDGTKLPLEETFRILAFISKLSKKHIKTIDQEYTKGVNSFPLSDNAFDILLKTQINRGNSTGLNDMLKEHYTEEVQSEQQQIINGAKNQISNTNCLIKQNYANLIRQIQWVHQYESDFIKKVIDIFIFDPSLENDVTSAPFFLSNENICWMPNLVAYASFAENLIENLIAKDLLSIHEIQTKYYERGLKNIFKFFNYNTIDVDSNKTFKDKMGNRLGDFDLLAYKDGHLLNIQLKLTGCRNSYLSRNTWKQGALKTAAKQLKTGLKFIDGNPSHIKQILGLNVDAPINKISSFILSNSYTYDHEFINGFLKLSYFEMTTLLIMLDFKFKNDPGDVDKLVQLIEENFLFRPLEELPAVEQNISFHFADYSIVRPGILSKNRYALL